MKKYLPQISCALLVIIFLIAFRPVAHAQAAEIAKLFGLGISGFFTEFFATTVNICLTIMGWFLSLAGALLNISINLTLNIKAFVEATPAIYDTWAIVRDISSLFIIFGLLYAALVKIIGVSSGPTYGNLIKNIVIFGILINFSFFLTSLGIDASNIISAQIYNQIAPTQNSGQNNSWDPASVDFALKSHGIADVFAQSLQIPHIYNTKFSTQDAGGVFSAPIKVILMGLTGIVIEFTAAMSFIMASMAFIVRFIILLVLLAFSPIWFVSHMMPQIKDLAEKASHWKDMYRSMLLFMPVYLLLMYMALRVLTSSGSSFNAGYTGNLVSGVAGDHWYSNFIVLGVNAFIVIFLLNMPLVVAVSVGGAATKWIDKSGWTGKDIWGRVGKGAQAWGNPRLFGRAASKIADTDAFKNMASKSRTAGLLLKGTRAVAEDYNKKLSEQVDRRTKFSESLGYDQNQMNTAQATLRTHQQRLAVAKAMPNTNPAQTVARDAAIAAAKASVGAARRSISTIENSRQTSYAQKTNSGSVDTLFTYIARKNKVAAAKMQIPILEKQLTQEKDDLKTTQGDIKQLNNTITNNPATGNTPAGTPTGPQATQLAALQRDEIRQTGAVNTIQGQIDNFKLVK